MPRNSYMVSFVDVKSIRVALRCFPCTMQFGRKRKIRGVTMYARTSIAWCAHSCVRMLIKIDVNFSNSLVKCLSHHARSFCPLTALSPSKALPCAHRQTRCAQAHVNCTRFNGLSAGINVFLSSLSNVCARWSHETRYDKPVPRNKWFRVAKTYLSSPLFFSLYTKVK